jgi:hypothetical protein
MVLLLISGDGVSVIVPVFDRNFENTMSSISAVVSQTLSCSHHPTYLSSVGPKMFLTK